jgi:hypothetical protein
MYLTKAHKFVIWDLTKRTGVLTLEYDAWDSMVSSDGTRLVSHRLRVVKMLEIHRVPIKNPDVARRHTETADCVTSSTFER